MILIIGATSFVGRAVVRRLAAERREVCCLLRPSRREQWLPTGIPFSTISASMNDVSALRTAMQDVTAVVHLTGEEDLDYGERTQQDHVQDTANLFTAAQEVSVRRLVYLSRLGADRASAYPLFRARGEAEATVRQSGQGYTILQAPLTYGPEDPFTNVLAMLAKTIPFVLPIPDVSLSRFQPLWIGDLVSCIVATLDRNDLSGQTIALGGPEHFTLDQLVGQILAAVRVRRRLVHLPAALLRGVIELFDQLLPHNPTPAAWLEHLAVGSATELGTIPRRFGFEPARFSQRLGYLSQRRPWRRDLVRLILTP